MKPGETFFGFDLGNHLWMVLSEPMDAGEVAVASLTTHGRSPTCRLGVCVVVQPGEHPFVTRESCVYYRKSELTSGEQLDLAKEKRTLQQHQPLSPELLARMQQGALDSDFVALEVQDAIKKTLDTDAGPTPNAG